MNLLEAVRDAWAWCGIDPKSIVERNAFGNLLIEAHDGTFWRLCPEDTYCERVADSQSELAKLWSDPEFVEDWQMENLVSIARQKLGDPGPDRCYCLRLPAALGGRYDGDNLATIAIEELIRFAGDLGMQIKDVPDGAQVVIESED